MLRSQATKTKTWLDWRNGSRMWSTRRRPTQRRTPDFGDFRTDARCTRTRKTTSDLDDSRVGRMKSSRRTKRTLGKLMTWACVLCQEFGVTCLFVTWAPVFVIKYGVTCLFCDLDMCLCHKIWCNMFVCNLDMYLCYKCFVTSLFVTWTCDYVIKFGVAR